MFLVELSYNTIKEEISGLQEKKSRKKDALQHSTSQLEKDHNKLIQFIDGDNLVTSQKVKDAEQATMENKAAETKIRNYDTKIQTLRSDIEKTLDNVNAIKEHKKFLFKIFMKENPKWVEEQMALKERKKAKYKDEWKKKQKDQKDTYNDFSFLPEMAALLKKEQTQNKSKGKEVKSKQAKNEDFLDQKFEQLLEMDLIDVGEDFYDEEILFENPGQLMEIYSLLEEQNLKMISNCQDVELQLENQQQMDKEIRLLKGRQIKEQMDLKRETQNKIKEARAQLYELQLVS